MLDLMRKKKESLIIKIVFVVIVLSFIGTIFLVWGKGDEGSRSGGGYAAKVDGSKVSLEDYQNAYLRLRDIYQQIYGQNMTPEIEKILGLKKLALDSLVDNMLVLKAAKGMGIKATKEEVAAEIAAMPYFQKDGAFSFDLYQQLLRSRRMTAKDFEESQKGELILKKARQIIKDKAVVSEEDALTQYKKENEKVDLEYVAYAPADVIGEIKLTDAELTDYLQKNQEQFKTAEKVSIAFARLDPSTLPAVTVNEDEMQTFYQKNIDRYQGKDGIQPLKDVKEQVRQDALKQKGAKQGYELVADTLFKDIKSGDLNLIAGKLKLKPQDTDVFSATEPPASLAGETAVIKKAFELKQGELGGPVETPRGIYIIKVKEKKPSTVPPLSEIKAAVEKKARETKSVDLAKTKAEAAVKLLASKDGSIKTQSTGGFGFSAKGDIPSIGISPDLMEAAFKLTPAAPVATAPVKIGARWFTVRLKSRTEAPKVEFDRTKEEIKKKLLPKKQEEALAAWIKELRSKAKIEINQTLLAEK